jgi:hypothetical protein
LLLLDLFYVMYFIHIDAHDKKSDKNLEIINESLCAVIFYHLLLFSEFNTNVDVKFTYGYTFIMTMGIVMAVNIGMAVLITI